MFKFSHLQVRHHTGTLVMLWDLKHKYSAMLLWHYILLHILHLLSYYMQQSPP
jgi:hypothetical protein